MCPNGSRTDGRITMPRLHAPVGHASRPGPDRALSRPPGRTVRPGAEWLEPRVLMARVSGMKFNDLDGDGVRDTISPVGAEPGLRGWTIYHDENENGALDAGEASDVTDAEGRYDFDFDAGDARGGPTSEVVREVPQAGWRPTTARGGSVTLSVRTLDSEV